MSRAWGALLSARSGLGATMLTLATSMLILGINLGTGVITARALGPEGRGELAAIAMWPQFMAFLLTLGLPSAALYNLRCHPDRGGALFSAVLMIGSIMALVATAAGMVVIPFWLTEYSPGVVRFARMMMVTAPFPLFLVTFTAVLQARDEFVQYNLTRLLQPAICLALLLTLLVAGSMTPFSAAVATLLAGVPVALTVLARLWRAYRPGIRSLRWAATRLLSYGVRSYGIDLLGSLANQIDRVMVVGLLDPARMGLYVVALSLTQMLNIFPTAVVTILFPRSSGKPLPDVIAMTGRAARVSLWAGFLIVAAAGVAGPVLLQLIYGEEFLGAVAVFRILLVEALLRGTLWVLAQAFMAVGRPGLVSVVQGIGLALTVPLLLVLVPRFGLIGAGLALLLSTSVRFVCVIASYPFVLRTAPPGLMIAAGDVAALRESVRRLGR